MPDLRHLFLADPNGAEVGVQCTPAGRGILIQQTDIGQRVARLPHLTSSAPGCTSPSFARPEALYQRPQILQDLFRGRAIGHEAAQLALPLSPGCLQQHGGKKVLRRRERNVQVGPLRNDAQASGCDADHLVNGRHHGPPAAGCSAPASAVLVLQLAGG
jgi:hypothetical protein